MSRKQPSAETKPAGKGQTESPTGADFGDVIWVCRRLAAALQSDVTILQALDRTVCEAPAGPRSLLSAMRDNLVTEATAGKGLISRVPSFVWGTMLSGELYGALGPALTGLADHLAAEQEATGAADPVLRDYSLALGRLGLMLQVRVPILQAMDAVAESAAVSEVREAMLAAREGVGDGGDLSEALSRVAAEVPPEAIEMIRDGEQAGRLAEALPIVADYLMDEAGQMAQRGK